MSENDNPTGTINFDVPLSGSATAAERKCPHCAETIKFEANLCRFCGQKLDPSGSFGPAITALVITLGASLLSVFLAFVFNDIMTLKWMMDAGLSGIAFKYLVVATPLAASILVTHWVGRRRGKAGHALLVTANVIAWAMMFVATLFYGSLCLVVNGKIKEEAAQQELAAREAEAITKDLRSLAN